MILFFNCNRVYYILRIVRLRIVRLRIVRLRIVRLRFLRRLVPPDNGVDDRGRCLVCIFRSLCLALF